ncbi:carbohydrate porin [Flavobacterium buctense]|uniref:Carbohydrate porin n=1 Tax=Flavobacterium buctense TaxID=1648146 RepID=A0ABU9E4E4_9FLAO|nr:carbohydrate porin [Flavobacterium buctense]
MKKKILFLLLFNFIFCFSQENDKTKKSLATQSNLTGDWLGARPWLSDNGITILPRITSFYEGMSSGDGDKKFEFSGKADVQIIFNGEKLGLWKGLKIITHSELNYGQSTIGYGGVLLPKNTALAFPGMNGSDYFDISSLFISQSVGSNKTLMVGKINMVDIASGTRFSGGAGIDNFLNVAFAAPPSGLVPPYIFGSLFTIKTKPLNYTFGIYDPISAVNKSGFENPFESGVTFFSSFEKPVKIAGKTGAHSLKVVYSTQNGTSLESLDDNLILPPTVGNEIVTKNNRYYLGYSFNQYLVQPTADVDKGWGLFGTIGFSDSDPTPINWSFLLGIGGNSPIKSRSADVWGIGYFHTSISNGLKDSALTASFVLNDESGLEAFYKAQLLPWFKLGIDFQMINPVLDKCKPASFVGLRSSIKL